MHDPAPETTYTHAPVDAPPFDAGAGQSPSPPPIPGTAQTPPIPQAAHQPTYQQQPPPQATYQPQPQAEPQPTYQQQPVQQQPAHIPPPPAQPQYQATTAMVPAQEAGMLGQTGNIMQELEAAGFEGLRIGIGAFPFVKLQGETFTTSEGESLGQTFVCVIHTSKSKKFYKCRDDQNAEEFFYTYDDVMTTANKQVQDILADWANRGWTQPVVKNYLDVTAQLVDLNTRELGGMVLLSVPDTSNPRFSGYITTLAATHRCMPNQVVTQIYPGQKVTSVKFPFHPWAFRYYAKVSDVVR